MQNNLICVHHGNTYGPEYVLNLWHSANRNSSVEFDFYVFTDNINQHPQDLGWKFVKLPNWNVARLKPWWYKLEIFNSQYQIEGNNLYLDLDVVIVKNIDCFWEHKPENFCICQDFNRAFNSNYPYSNSSIMAWHRNSMAWLYRKFVEDMQFIIHKYRGDQDFIHAETRNNRVWWPTEWAMSWKWEIKHGGQSVPHGKYKSVEPYIIPTETRVIVCHGNPNPHEVNELSSYWHK